MKQHNDLTRVAVGVDSQIVQVFEELFRTLWTIIHVRGIIFFAFAAQENGCLQTTCVGHGFVIGVHKGRHTFVDP